MASNTRKKNALGFPPPLLGEAPYRLQVLVQTEDWLALDKPAGVGMRAYPWDEAKDLDSALNEQLVAGKPELMRTEATLFGSAYYLDPEISGVAVFAKNRDALADLRNRFGSGDYRFTFRFVAANDAAVESEFVADAPLLPHRTKPKMIPSTAKGKKSFTQFKRLVVSDLGWSLWEARTQFFRVHQVRCHAATHGIPVLGDLLYGGPDAPTVRQLQPRKQRADLDVPVYSGLAIHLSEVQLSPGTADCVVHSDYPKHLALLLRRMGLGD